MFETPNNDERWKTLALQMVQRTLLDRADLKLTVTWCDSYVGELEKLGLTKKEARAFAEWLLTSVVHDIFASLPAVEETDEKSEAGGDGPPTDGTGGPPSDDDIPF